MRLPREMKPPLRQLAGLTAVVVSHATVSRRTGARLWEYPGCTKSVLAETRCLTIGWLPHEDEPSTLRPG
jgi:hypothetical protein